MNRPPTLPQAEAAEKPATPAPADAPEAMPVDDEPANNSQEVLLINRSGKKTKKIKGLGTQKIPPLGPTSGTVTMSILGVGKMWIFQL